MSDTALVQQLEAILREAGDAHHYAFEAVDGNDPEWPLWYADRLHPKLGPLLNASFSKSELVYLLVLVAKEQALHAPGANWVRYYARFFLQRYQ